MGHWGTIRQGHASERDQGAWEWKGTGAWNEIGHDDGTGQGPGIVNGSGRVQEPGMMHNPGRVKKSGNGRGQLDRSLGGTVIVEGH